MTTSSPTPPARERAQAQDGDAGGADATRESRGRGLVRVALLGNPNTGKTTLFNALCGVRSKTSNYPGTTQEARVGRLAPSRGERTGSDAQPVMVMDLPGVYSLELEQSESEIVRQVLAGTLAPPGAPAAAPDVACVVVDASNLERNMHLVGEVCRRRLPMVVALTMQDIAVRRGRAADAGKLAAALGCPVIVCNGRDGQGVQELRAALAHAAIPNYTPPGTQDGLEAWATRTAMAALPSMQATGQPSAVTATDRLDRVVTHPVLGLVAFLVVMFLLFYAIFSVATLPMGWIEAGFAAITTWAKAALPAGLISDFLVDGVLAGLGATLVFLPQICLLFFLISLLEDTGYLARAAFLVDRFLRPFGLSGYAFVPLLSSHACALPGIMATRQIPEKRERLAAILVAPFMSCSARIPVYVLLTSLLFPHRPMEQALAFIACYALGAGAGLFSALLARRTILRGKARAMALELPTYKRPSLRTATLTMVDRGWVFLKKAGTNILAICIVLWWLSAFPHAGDAPKAVELRGQAQQLIAHDPTPEQQARHDELLAQSESVQAAYATSQSYLGRLGRGVQPIFEPLGYDWQLSVGVLASFAAREVFASTMGVITSAGDDVEDEGTIERIAGATRDDGVTRIFTPATSWSLLVYFVLAMQCLPTLAVTAKESGHVKWALLQLVWMCGLAYVAALVVFRVAGSSV